MGEFRPTHAVYLDATADFIAAAITAQQGGDAGLGGGGGGGKDTEATVRSDLERYFSEEQKQLDAEDAAALLAAESDSKNKNPEGGEPNNSKDSHARILGSGLDDENTTAPRPRWIPATIRTLQRKFPANTEVIDAEQEDLSRVVDAVDLHLAGGEVPAFVWMLGGGDGRGDNETGDIGNAAKAEDIEGAEGKRNAFAAK